ncbi:hypothetical protein SAMN04487995_5627 [Dyadobacter koreensis]|uniref:Uncharacterized protein n=2 Tax=Dyadobacter koreensis TaxID=408657 RepID=A0A1H7ACU8_9BACT|nr:hypothetical protein SAMN04487995_5627 [Dyadobacter koreensis]
MLLNNNMNTRYKGSFFKFSVKLFSIVFLFFLMGCDQPEEKAVDKKMYYDLKGFIETQITFLSEQKPTVNKILTVAGKNESRSTKEVDWKKELELFIQADINKPAYSKSFEVTKPDSLTSTFTLKTDENIPVKSVTVRLDKITGNPVLIKALLKSENKLYQSEKNIELHCIGESNQWHVTYYSIKGYQKLATMDKKDFSIESKVIY